MNKLLPILLVVVLSGCGNKFSSVVESLSNRSENLTGSQLVCEYTGQSTFNNKIALGEIYSLKFVSNSKLIVYQYNSRISEYDFMKGELRYTTTPDGINIWIYDPSGDEPGYVSSIHRESLKVKLATFKYVNKKIETEKVINYGTCKRNDSFDAEEFFTNIVNKNKNKKSQKNKI